MQTTTAELDAEAAPTSPLPAPRSEGNRPRRSSPGAGRAGDNPGQPAPGQSLQLTAADLTRPPGSPGTSPAPAVKDSLTTPPAVEAAAAPSVPSVESVPPAGTTPPTPVPVTGTPPPNKNAAPISGGGVESSTKPEGAAAPTRTEDNRIAVRATGATSDSDVEMQQSPDIVNTELSTPPPERDPAKSAKAKILAHPAKYLPDMTPKAVLDEIKNWPVVSKSPFSASLYDITNKSFGPDPEGHLRLADHWNYTTGGEEVHGKTDRKVPEHSWALASKESGVYRVLKVWKSLNEDLRIKFKAERAAKAKITAPQREILLALEKGPVQLTPKQARTMKAWWSKGGWYFTEAMEGATASLNAVGRAVVKNGKINLAAATKLANSFKTFPKAEEIPIESLPLLSPAPRSPLPASSADLTLQSPTTT